MVPIRYNFRSLAVRKATTLATAIGIGFVVFVLTGSQMLSEGITKTLTSSGRDDIAIVLRKGSDNELSSTIEDSQISLITGQVGVKSSNGKPLSAAEVIVVAAMEKIGSPGVTNLTLRGVGDDVLTFRPSVKVIAGRAPKPGSDEAMVGVRIRGRFRGTDLGQKIEIKKNRAVTVVGIFEDSGSSYESEAWVDIDTLRTSFGREGMRSSVRVQLDSKERFDAFQMAVEQDKRLGLTAMRETKYFEKLSENTSIFFKALGIVVTVFFSIGAIIGAAITMYAAVANRQREIGILRALGFSRFALLVSFVSESVFLALIGGLLGTAGALILGTVKLSVMNFSSWSEIVFTFEPTVGILTAGIVFSLVLGFLGGFLPALRASRVSPVIAMRGS